MSLTAIDIGGTHARFARAEVTAGQTPELSAPLVLRTADFAGLPSAWRAYCETLDTPPPGRVSICFAGPVRGDTLAATNSHWVIERPTLAAQMGVDQVHLMNDFGAMAYGVSQLPASELLPVCGPVNSNDGAHDQQRVCTVMGPGTGLGVAILLIRGDQISVLETEGGHVDFAPLDAMEANILDHLREQFRRVSVERVVSGPGLNHLVQAIARIEGRNLIPSDDAALWTSALDPDNADELKQLALQRFCMSYGAVAGDLALAHGATEVVLVGGLSQRLYTELQKPQFSRRFCAKGRYELAMAKIPVRLACHEQLGLLGAAAGLMANDRAESSTDGSTATTHD